MKIDANGNLTQSYTESFFNVGGSPRAIWSGLVQQIQGRTSTYPYRLVLKIDLSSPSLISLVWERDTTYDGIIQDILSRVPTNRIKADNIFIAARYLNINGTIEAGHSEYNITFGSEVASRIDSYKNAGIRSQNYKDYPLYYGEVGYFYYYDPVANAIVLEPIAVRGGYIELFGHIISTGNGTIKALDGYGTINVQNNTGYDLIIKGLDTGIGSKGVVIITDTSKKKPGYDNVYLQGR